MVILCIDTASRYLPAADEASASGAEGSDFQLSGLVPWPAPWSEQTFLQWIQESLPRVEVLKAFDQHLETTSLFQSRLRPLTTAVRLRLGAGNESVVLGRDGWLFYRPDLEHLTQPFNRSRVRKAAAALIDLQHQLTARQIELLVVPVPVKPSIYPEKLSSRFDPQASPLPDPTLEALFGMLSSAEVPYLDLARLLAQLKSSQPAYLATDTHWTPAGVEQAVEGIHTWIHRHRPQLAQAPRRLFRVQLNLGDTARMLGLPDWHLLAQPERAELIFSSNLPPKEPPSVLLLGDSFSNIYSLEAMGWGQGAGLAARLEDRIGRRVETITRNDGGATAVRVALARRLARDPQLLQSIRLVIYQFSARELSRADWRLLDFR